MTVRDEEERHEEHFQSDQINQNRKNKLFFVLQLRIRYDKIFRIGVITFKSCKLKDVFIKSALPHHKYLHINYFTLARLKIINLEHVYRLDSHRETSFKN